MKRKKLLWLPLVLITAGSILAIAFATASTFKNTSMNTKPTSGKIIYVYDALCGWCYGFSPVIQQLHENYSGQLEFEVVSGGMVTGERIGPISDMADYISKAHQDVEKASGVKFGKEFLEETLYRDDVVLTSVPPALALSVFKTFKPEMAVHFAAAIQKEIYYHGAEPALSATYGKLAKDFGLDSSDFINAMNNPATLALAEAEFLRSRTLGVNGFPTTFYEDARGNLIQLSRGFTNYHVIDERLKQAMKTN